MPNLRKLFSSSLTSGTNKLDKFLNLVIGKQSSLIADADSDEEKGLIPLMLSVKVIKSLFFNTDVMNK